MKINRVLIIVVFAAASLFRLVDALRPIDRSSWRESDVGSISRNFVREGMNPFYPRIDWRGTGPGYAEMEFPLYPWLIAVTYKLFGFHDVLGRLWSFAFSIGALYLFLKLARESLSEYASIAAFAFFAVNPLILDASTALKPEGLLILSYIGAVYFFLRWYRSEKASDFAFAIVMTTLALLSKATATHIGIFFGVLLFQKFGKAVFYNWRVWLFGLATVLPAAAWYIHAKLLWINYGNSLGVSNEYHWVGPDFITNPYFIKGILGTEAADVWLVFGIAVAIFALSSGIRVLIAQRSLIWLASAFVMYIVAARTTADDWASYYHIFSVPPAALLFGFGLERLGVETRKWADNFSRFSLSGTLARLALGGLVVVAALATFGIAAERARAEFRSDRRPASSFDFGASLKPVLKRAGLILVSGSSCYDEDGYPVAYNSSFMFYALDRKGSNICVEDQSPERIISFSDAGYQYFIAQRMEIAKKPGLDAWLNANYPLLAKNDEYEVFDLAATEGP
ncbi:MAG: glycosyltransferase family 39 protein [Acidobacteriota bacterium]